MAGPMKPDLATEPDLSNGVQKVMEIMTRVKDMMSALDNQTQAL